MKLNGIRAIHLREQATGSAELYTELSSYPKCLMDIKDRDWKDAGDSWYQADFKFEADCSAWL